MARSKPTLFEQLKDEERPQAPQNTWNASRFLRWVIIVACMLATAAFFPGRSGDSQRKLDDENQLGTMWTEESVVAPYAFSVRKLAAALDEEHERARKSTPLVFRAVPSAIEESKERLLIAAENAPAPVAALLRRRGDALLNDAFSVGVIDVDDAVIKTPMIVVDLGSVAERIIPKTEVRDMGGVHARLAETLAAIDPQTRNASIDIIKRTMMPTLRLDSALTQRARDEAVASVPTMQEIVRSGDVIIRKGARLDERSLARLMSFRDAEYLRSEVRFSPFIALGSLGHAVVLIGLLVLYLRFMRRSSYVRNGQLASLLFMPVITAAMGWLSIVIPTDLPLEYAILAPALAMIVSVLYDARTACMCAVVMALSAAGARGNDYSIAIVLITSGTLAALAGSNIQNRTQIFTAIISIFLGLSLITVAISLERSMMSHVWPTLIIAAVNAVASTLVTFAVIIVLERVFNVATDMRLEEFDNANHPLLQQLNDRAPGTYQHTLAVARLAEAAATAIGANALLTKVGALFHDIGKLEKSEYFVENQIDIGNKHDKITPKKSAAIIRQHVQDGTELAKEYRLPYRIWKFIPMHHGTMLIRHFYARALDESHGGVVDEQDYRYQGPKPDSKETAILMLADATEALSRLVDTSQREDIEAAVDRIIVDRFEDGQLSDAPLTTADLALIRESLVKNLLASSHKRVRYREVDPSDAATPQQ